MARQRARCCVLRAAAHFGGFSTPSAGYNRSIGAFTRCYERGRVSPERNGAECRADVVMMIDRIL